MQLPIANLNTLTRVGPVDASVSWEIIVSSNGRRALIESRARCARAVRADGVRSPYKNKQGHITSFSTHRSTAVRTCDTSTGWRQTGIVVVVVVSRHSRCICGGILPQHPRLMYGSPGVRK
jgi:hypothetical protein